jgi:hypothetical protein
LPPNFLLGGLLATKLFFLREATENFIKYPILKIISRLAGIHISKIRGAFEEAHAKIPLFCKAATGKMPRIPVRHDVKTYERNLHNDAHLFQPAPCYVYS